MTTRFLFASLLACFFASCAGGDNYSNVPASEPHAVIKTGRVIKNPFPFVVSDTNILMIDRKEPPFMRMGDSFRVTPGSHSLLLENVGVSSSGLAQLRFEAQQGRTYVVKSDEVTGRVKFWIDDSQSGKPVTGAESPRLPAQPKMQPPMIMPVLVR